MTRAFLDPPSKLSTPASRGPRLQPPRTLWHHPHWHRPSPIPPGHQPLVRRPPLPLPPGNCQHPLPCRNPPASLSTSFATRHQTQPFGHPHHLHIHRRHPLPGRNQMSAAVTRPYTQVAFPSSTTAITPVAPSVLIYPSSSLPAPSRIPPSFLSPPPPLPTALKPRCNPRHHCSSSPFLRLQASLNCGITPAAADETQPLILHTPP